MSMNIQSSLLTCAVSQALFLSAFCCQRRAALLCFLPVEADTDVDHQRDLEFGDILHDVLDAISRQRNDLKLLFVIHFIVDLEIRDKPVLTPQPDSCLLAHIRCRTLDPDAHR